MAVFSVIGAITIFFEVVENGISVPTLDFAEGCDRVLASVVRTRRMSGERHEASNNEPMRTRIQHPENRIQKVENAYGFEDVAGGTPTAATETVALPKADQTP